LKELGLDPQAPVEPQDHTSGGRVGRDENGQLNGLLQENAAPGLRRLIDEIPGWRLPQVLFSARDDYLKAGVTTVQNGYADRSMLRLLRWGQRLGLIKQRLVLWPAHDKLANDPFVSAGYSASEYQSAITPSQAIAGITGWPESDRENLALGAMKLIADGSPQGRTAWMSEPYLPDQNIAANYQGIPTIPERQLHELMLQYHRTGVQLAIHGNGDAAIDSIISGVQKAMTQAPRVDARHMIVHAQTIRPDQLQALANLDVTVSFFPAHTYHWGDWYRKRVYGEHRAAGISPLRSAEKAGLRFSLHSDAPVTAMQPMQILWSATERLTRSGFRLGSAEKISRQSALRALTIDAAWQNFLDDDRGSLEPGKLADFVVLSDNPLTASDVRSITVEQVWIGGELVYVE
jgi:predicted amidohydrolase YtcJ